MLVLILSANLMDRSPFSQCAYTGENTSAEHWCYLKYFHCVMYPSGWKRESFITPTLKFLNLGTTDILDRIAVVENCPMHCRKYTIPVLHVLGADSIPPSAPSAKPKCPQSSKTHLQENYWSTCTKTKRTMFSATPNSWSSLE